ncbi:HipA-like protein [Brunnivagina elsteri]|uniref:HipA-like protein n=1 Tax=Brunnivagina elsteri CCALA 953 TaxID=987040 RepID=A0A2A2TL93_9CYAN|nr:HipA-like protein [Calothrix elsteri]PAX58306.1 HipA-like protein [Calothrix elsteri CCALA 953]
MTSEFPIFLVTQKAYEESSNETLGSKYKFWFHHEEFGRCLYKQSRENLGEDWAEKVASELCKLLGLPHAIYELASTWEGSRGVISPNFLPQRGTLVHGNELLSSIVQNYPAFATYGVSQHTIDVVLQAIANKSVNLPIDWTAPSEIETAIDVFVGYLLLDAWIGNGDRHHENWGIVRIKAASTLEETEHLAPTYDHASSLGRDLSDEQRQKRSVEAYANRCSSAFYGCVDDRKTLKTLDAFSLVANRYPKAACVWLARLENITEVNILDIFNRINPTRISPDASNFARSILKINKHKLLNLRETLL